MGYWPSKIPCFLNIVLMVGYCTIDCIIGGQMLAAVSDGAMSIAVGIVIVSLVSWVVAVFGMGIFHHYERQVFLPLSAAVRRGQGKECFELTILVDGLGSPKSLSCLS